MTLGKFGNAYLAAATFERARLAHVKAPTNQTGLSVQERSLAIEACERDIAKYEERAQACFKAALTREARDVAQGYQFQKVEA